MKLSEQELAIAYDTLVKVAASLNADCNLIHKKTDTSGGWIGIVMIRSRSDAVQTLEIRVACTLHPLIHYSHFRHRKRRCWEKHIAGYLIQLTPISLY